MIQASDFINPAKALGFNTWAGVPCSFLTPFINSVIDDPGMTYISSANEGDAVATASGAALAGQRAVAMMVRVAIGRGNGKPIGLEDRGPWRLLPDIDRRAFADDWYLRSSDRDRREQRLAVSVSVEVQAVETRPTPLEDHQRSAVVPSPKFSDRLVPGVDHAEVVLSLYLGRDVEADLDLQVFLGSGGRRWTIAACVVDLGHLRDVPRRPIDGRRARLLGLRDGPTFIYFQF